LDNRSIERMFRLGPESSDKTSSEQAVAAGPGLT